MSWNTWVVKALASALLAKAIAYTWLGDNILWAQRLGFQLAAQIADVHA